jgi:hypothetical protein
VAYALELVEDVFWDAELLECGVDGGYHVVDYRTVYRRLRG